MAYMYTQQGLSFLRTALAKGRVVGAHTVKDSWGHYKGGSHVHVARSTDVNYEGI